MRSKTTTPTEEYLERAKQLSNDDADRLMARMRGRFTRRFAARKLTALQAIALQLEFEEEELAQWRDRMQQLRVSFDKDHKPARQSVEFTTDRLTLN